MNMRLLSCNTCHGEGCVEMEDPMSNEINFEKCPECLGGCEIIYPCCQQCDNELEME